MIKWLTRSISRKLITLILLSITIPVAVSIFITYTYTKNFLYKNAVQQNTTIIDRGAEELQRYFKSLNDASLAFYSNQSLYAMLIDESSFKRTDLYYGLHTIASTEGIHQIYLQSFVHSFAYSFVEGHLKRSASILPDIPLSDKPYGIVLQQPHESRNYGITDTPYVASVPVITLTRTLYRAPSTEEVGLLSIDVKLDSVREMLRQMDSNTSTDISVLNSDSSLLFSSRDVSEPVLDHSEIAREIAQRGKESGWLEIRDKDFSGLVFFHTIQAFGIELIVVKQVSDSYLYANAKQITFINSLVTLLCLSVSVITVLLVSFHLTTPIKQLIRYVNRIRSGKLNTVISLDRQDEFGVLAEQFQSMVDTINQLIVNEYQVKLANQQNQIKMLQAQINPHFLNNTLQAIGSVALDYNAPEVYRLISSLGKMMIYSMYAMDKLVPLKDELEYNRHYLTLQQQRFGDRLHFTIEAHESSLNVLIPKMTLQPIIENYFKHTEDIHSGLLTVAAEMQGNWLHIKIRDNGNGIAPERLLGIQQQLLGLHSARDVQEQIGLLNVLIRLQYYFGSDTKILLSSPEEQGVLVDLVIPVKKGGYHI